MIPGALRLTLRVAGRKATVPIAQCVHYGGFRYGHGEEHPYEMYARLSAAGSPARARAWFVDFLRCYRPRHLGEALGVDLSSEYPLWFYPWAKFPPQETGWTADPHELPDIVTFYSDTGILWFRIEQEFFWLERALYLMRRDGYRPDTFGHIIAKRLVDAKGAESFLVLDGNHRLSALAALGQDSVEIVYLPRSTVSETELAHWPQVRRGIFTAADARLVLQAYFTGNSRWRIAAVPAPVLGCPYPVAPGDAEPTAGNLPVNVLLPAAEARATAQYP